MKIAKLAIVVLLAILAAFLVFMFALASQVEADTTRPDPVDCPDLQAGVATLFFPADTQTSGVTVEFVQTICGQPVITLGNQDSWGMVGVAVSLTNVTNNGFGLTGHLDYVAPQQGHTVLVHWHAVQATQ